MTVPIHQTTSLAYEPQVTASIVIEEEEIKEDVKEVSSDVLCNCYKYSEVTSGIDLPPMVTGVLALALGEVSKYLNTKTN